VELLQIGRRFGRLVVQHNVRKYFPHIYRVRVQCDCGRIKTVGRFDLLNGDTRSCGCFQKSDLARRSRGNAHGVTHGFTRASASAAMVRTYSSLKAMWARTTNPKSNRGLDWRNYGGATPPVTVCNRWLRFENFLADSGCRKSGTTLGRFKDRGDYKPGNCAWQNTAQQAAEHRRAHVQ